MASDVWSAATRTLTGAGLTAGSLATLSDVQTASSSLAAVVNANTDAQTSAVTTAVNSNTNTAVLNASTSLAANINQNTNTQTSGIVSGVNSNTNTQVSNASTSIGSMITSLPATIWSFGSRSLTTFGTLASDVWDIATSTLITNGSIGNQIVSNLDTAVSAVNSSSLTAADIWAYTARTLTSGSLNTGSLALLSDIQSASSSLNTSINTSVSSINSNTNTSLNTASSSLASVINANTNTAIATASSSLFATIPASVWSYSARTLTSIASLANDVWNASTRTLTSLTLSSQTPWTVGMSDFGTIAQGEVYRSTVTTVYNGTLTDSMTTPTITIYDPNRNVVVNAAAMTRTSTGTYEYAYTTSGSATAGVWESVISATVESGKTLPGNDYWNVTASPPQVIILGMNSTVTPNISADVRITNEGDAPYEYQYEWCVVSSLANPCGGSDDVYYGSAAKLINPGDNFDTTLTATVPTAGAYYFRVVVYYGTERSGSSRSFTATASSSGSGGSGGSGGGGGGGGGGPAPVSNPNVANVIASTGGACSGADFNRDKKVNSIDFSILLAFWKTDFPFSNACVDVNGDKKVNSVDFSILLSQWGIVR